VWGGGGGGGVLVLATYLWQFKNVLHAFRFGDKLLQSWQREHGMMPEQVQQFLQGDNVFFGSLLITAF